MLLIFSMYWFGCAFSGFKPSAIDNCSPYGGFVITVDVYIQTHNKEKNSSTCLKLSSYEHFVLAQNKELFLFSGGRRNLMGKYNVLEAQIHIWKGRISKITASR